MAVTMADITKLRKMTGAGTVSYTHLVPIVRVLTARVVTVLSVPMATVRNVLHIIVKVVTVPIAVSYTHLVSFGI